MLIKVPLTWLREYVDITVPIDELALKVHMSSTEVKGVERPWWSDKVRVGRIAKLAKHPNADKLQLATVEYGEGRQKTVVTGATNLDEGAIVPFAEEGAEIIDGHTGERTVLKLESLKLTDASFCSQVDAERPEPFREQLTPHIAAASHSQRSELHDQPTVITIHR